MAMPDPLDARALVDALASAVLAADVSDRIVYLNGAAERVFAWSEGDLRGQPFDVLLPERLRGQHPRYLHHLFDEGTGPTRVHAMRKDGVEMDVEVSLAKAGPLLVVSIHGVREEPRVPADERYRLVFENAPVGLIHWDARGVVTGCNDAMLAILGASREQVIGLNILTLKGDPSREALTGLVRQTLQGKPARFEGPYTSQTGQKTTHVQALLAPIGGPSGVLGGLGIVEDVNERKRIELAMARTERMASIGTLAAGVAHEINNPLAFASCSGCAPSLDRRPSRTGNACIPGAPTRSTAPSGSVRSCATCIRSHGSTASSPGRWTWRRCSSPPSTWR